MSRHLSLIWQSAMRPSEADETPDYTFRQALAHALLGAGAGGLASLVWALVWWLGVLVAVVCWGLYLLKEARDLRLGGSVIDGAVDTLEVGIGFLVGLAVGGVALVLSVAGFGVAAASVVIRERRAGR